MFKSLRCDPLSAEQRLPDGVRFYGPSRLELAFLFDEIFVEQTYAIDGIPAQGATVVDVGAHVGLFCLFAQQVWQPARLIALEPIPSTFATLQANAQRHFPQATLLPVAAGSTEETATFTVYRGVGGWSSRYPDEQLLREALPRSLDAVDLGGWHRWYRRFGALAPGAREWLLQRYLSAKFRRNRQIACAVRPIASLIHEQRLERVDLLKVDAEGAELDVLRGVHPTQWAMIDHIVLEIQDVDRQLDQVVAHLEGEYSVHVAQTRALRDTPYHVVHARR